MGQTHRRDVVEGAIGTARYSIGWPPMKVGTSALARAQAASASPWVGKLIACWSEEAHVSHFTSQAQR